MVLIGRRRNRGKALVIRLIDVRTENCQEADRTVAVVAVAVVVAVVVVVVSFNVRTPMLPVSPVWCESMVQDSVCRDVRHSLTCPFLRTPPHGRVWHRFC